MRLDGARTRSTPTEHCCEVLLELDAPVHRDQRVVLGPHTSEKLAVRDASPATAHYGVDTVALERRGEV